MFLSSCYVNREIVSVVSGDNSEGVEVKDLQGNVKNLTDNQTFGTYKKDGNYIVEPTNEIFFNIDKKERVRWRLRLRRRTRGKERYAFVAVDKSFYKFQLWRPIVSILAIPFTYGSSLFLLPPSPHKKTTITTSEIKHEEFIDQMIFSRKILIEANIWCKRDVINDNVVIVENLPDIMTVRDYKVKLKKGKRRIDDVKYEKKIIDGETCHVFTIKAKNGVFKKKNKVWIILDVFIKPTSENISN